MFQNYIVQIFNIRERPCRLLRNSMALRQNEDTLLHHLLGPSVMSAKALPCFPQKLLLQQCPSCCLTLLFSTNLGVTDFIRKTILSIWHIEEQLLVRGARTSPPLSPWYCSIIAQFYHFFQELVHDFPWQKYFVAKCHSQVAWIICGPTKGRCLLYMFTISLRQPSTPKSSQNL